MNWKAFAQSRLLLACLFLAVLAPAVWLRFHALDRQSLWQDEIHTALYVNDHPSLAQVVHRVATWDLHSPLYYVLLRMHVWVLQAGGIPLTDGNLRVLSAILGSLAVAAVFLFGCAVWRNPWWALAAMVAAGFGMYGIYYSQELRMYALILLLATLALWFQLQLWDSQGRVRPAAAWGFALACIGLLYSSLIGIFFVAGAFAALLGSALWDRKANPALWKVPVFLAAAVALCYLPWLGVMWRQSMSLKEGVWTGMAILNPRELLKFALENVLTHAWKLGHADLLNKTIRVLAPLAFLNLLDKEHRKQHAVILGGFCLTFLIYYVLTYGRPFHTGRYFAAWWPYVLYLIPAAFSGVAALVRRFFPRAAWIAPAAAALFCVLFTVVQAQQWTYYATQFEKQNFRRAVQYLNAAGESAVLVNSEWHRKCFAYYGLQRPVVTVNDPPAAGLRRYYVDGAPIEKTPAMAGLAPRFQPVAWDIPSLMLWIEKPWPENATP